MSTKKEKKIRRFPSPGRGRRGRRRRRRRSQGDLSFLLQRRQAFLLVVMQFLHLHRPDVPPRGRPRRGGARVGVVCPLLVLCPSAPPWKFVEDPLPCLNIHYMK